MAADGTVHRYGDTTRIAPVASITKLATALGVLLAVEEGLIGLDDPAGPAGSTVRHLLCHASGLAFDSGEVLMPPGRRRIYSNSGYDALAAVVERAGGLAFDEYLLEGVLAPLGAHGAELRGSAAKDLHAGADDLVLIASEWRRPRLLHPSTLDEARSPQLPWLAGVVPGWGRHDPCWWGLGPELRGDKSPHWTGSTAQRLTYGHFGGSGTFLWIDPDSGLCCALISDREFGDWALDAWPAFSDEVRAAYG